MSDDVSGMNQREAWAIAIASLLLAPFFWLLEQCRLEVRL